MFAGVLTAALFMLVLMASLGTFNRYVEMEGEGV